MNQTLKVLSLLIQIKVLWLMPSMIIAGGQVTQYKQPYVAAKIEAYDCAHDIRINDARILS